MTTRMAVGVAGMVYLRHVLGHTPQPFGLAALATPLAGCAFGMGLAVSPLFQTVLKLVPHHQAGVGPGAMQGFQQVGAAVGIAIVSSLFFTRLKASGGTDRPAATTQGLIYQLCAFGAILTIRALRKGGTADQRSPARRSVNA